MKSLNQYRGLILCVWIILLPFWDFGAGLFLGMAFILGCFSKTSFLKLFNLSLLPWSFFFLAIFGGFWTFSLDLKYLYRLLPFFLIPIAVSGCWRWVRSSLPIGGLILCIYLLSNSLFSFWENGDLSLIFYRELTGSLHQHIYLISYLSLGVVSIYEIRLRRTFQIIFLWIVLTTISLLGSKIGLFALLIAGIFYLKNIVSNFHRKQLVFLFFILGIFSLSQKFSDGRSLGHVFRPISAYWATGSVDTRIVQNTAAINIWSENFLFGVGQTKIQDELMIEYQNENYRFGLKRKSNVHNQILQYAATYGLLGLIWISLGFFLSYRINFLHFDSLQKRKAIVCIIFFGCLFITESFLERSLGISSAVLGWMWVACKDQDFIS